MDPYSSGEELVIKTRKPYTITKQRERWTEEEHKRFLEALKLYGRAWQCIEEHIGTKTAVQIRSHAQKFFTKLEKEALVKGVPIRQALDIEIPPPRPKRKPSNPYPRKTGVATPTSQVTAKDGKPVTSVLSLSSGKSILDLEKELLPETPVGVKKLGNANKDEDEENCTEGFSLSQEALCASLSSANENCMSKTVSAINSCTFREFVPVLEEVMTQDETNESYVTVEAKGNQKLDKHDPKQTNATSNTSNFGNSHPPHENLVLGQNTDKLGHPGIFGALSMNDMQAAQNYPRHVPVHIVDGNLGMSSKNVSGETSYGGSTLHQTGKVHGHPSLFANLVASATTMHHNNASSSSINQTFPPFHPLFTPIRDNQEDYRSFFQISSMFSGLIVSSLLQNPAAHAAASFAAALWPCANMKASSGDSSARQLNSSAPSMAALAATTVAAATAWWAAHGLLPVCAPFYTGFTSATPFAFAASMDNNQARVANNGKENTHTAPEGVKLDAEHSEALPEQNLPSKLPTLSLSEDSEGSGDKKLNTGSSDAADSEKAVAEADLHDSSKTKIRKLVDRSSCGSNTTSSSEIETDALEKHEKPKEESKEPDASHTSSDSTNRRSRSSFSPNESWKEVSEEGRLAFQALFSREVLPQSFSPPHGQLMNNTEKGQQKVIQNNEGVSHLDLNSRLWVTCSSQPVEKSVNTFAFLRGKRNGEEGLLTMGHGQAKMKIHQTGFKPYKRCSIETKENRMVSTGSQNDEKCPKRMRLEGEAST